MKRLNPHRIRWWLLGFAAWTMLGLLSATQSIAWRAYTDRPVDWLAQFRYSLTDWYTCGIYTPILFWLVRRYPIRGRERWSNSAIHTGAGVVYVFAKLALLHPLLGVAGATFQRTYLEMVIGGFYADFLGYWAVIGVIHALEYYRESRDRQVETSQLESRLRQSELENLRAQLQPHFLFNTLQSISTLIHRDPLKADRMLTDLSDLLRVSIRHSGNQEVPLRDELAFLEKYLDIMRIRFGDRLTIGVVAGQEVLGALVPSLVLQPLVENAIRHGMADRADVGHVEIRAARNNGVLTLEVQDDGPGLSENRTEMNGGIGLANTRERLDRLYGSAHRLAIGGEPGRGLKVSLDIPYRPVEPAT